MASSSAFCFDTETTGIDVLSAELVGIAFCFEEGKAQFWRSPDNFEETQKQLTKLKQKGGLSVELWDERCTTLSAHQALSTAGVRGKKRKSVVDAVAACMILEDFLRFRRGQKNMAF